MKKLLSILTLLCCMAIYAGAQTVIFSQNFETSKTVSPAGWHQQLPAADPSNKGWEFNNKFPGVLAGYIPSHTYYTFVDDYDNNTGNQNNDTLYTPSFNCTAYSKVFISVDALLWIYNGSETASIVVSTDGGVTWNMAADLTTVGGLGSNSWANSLTFDISTYAAGQANVMLGFTYSDGFTASGGYAATGMALDNISVFSPAAYDMSVVQSTASYLSQPSQATTFTGYVYNWGGTAITSFNLNYTVNGGPVQTDNITTTINSLAAYNYSHSIKWTPSVSGLYTVKYWCDNFNGSNADMNNVNDTLWAYYTVVDTIAPKIAMFEQFTQASCNPCMYAQPNATTVLKAAAAYTAVAKYHPNFPGYDLMNQVTNSFVNTRINYYGVTGIPDARIDGTTDVNPASVTTGEIQAASNMGSPMKVTITSATCTHDLVLKKDIYNIQASIKSFATIPENTYARVVLTVDTIKYDSNQSDEDPTKYFNPPLGKGGYGLTDNYYPYLRNFPEVAEDMMPSSTGSTLTAFAMGQTQTINVSWTKSHSWGDSATHPKHGYDSLFPGEHLTIFIQDDQAKANTERSTATGSFPTHANTGAGTQYIYQTASSAVTKLTGFEELSDGTYFNMYPNPTNGNSNIAFTLDKEQSVGLDVFNLLGEKVYSASTEKMSVGEHTIVISGQTLQPGIYLVRFTTNNVTTTKKLIIQK